MSARQATSKRQAPKPAHRQRTKAAASPTRSSKAETIPETDGDEEDDEFVDREPVDGDDEFGLVPEGHDGKSTLKEDPALDRRIIEGMLRDRKLLLEELAKEGMGTAAVLRRAAELGLSEALLRQVKGVAADLAGERPGRRAAPSALGARTCLSCDRVFLSTGPGNRLCMRCRGGDAGLAQF